MWTAKSTNGISYLVRINETPEKRVLIFHPGIGAYKESYIRFLDRLSPWYSAVYCIDLPEQGSKGRWSIGVMTENLRELIRMADSDSVEWIDLGGHSAGALAIISFIVNYNAVTEKHIIDAVRASSEEAVLNEILRQNGFAEELPEASKIKRLFLYAPPYSFDSVISRKLTTRVGAMSAARLKRTMNCLVNRPLHLASHLSSGKYFRFTLDRTGRVQFFKLATDDHKSLISYLSGYITLFELYSHLDSDNRQRADSVLDSRRIVIQIGGIDWVAGDFIFRGNNREELFRITPGIITHRHRLLGHLFRWRMSPDVNLNLQALSHPAVTRMTINYL